MKVWEARHIQNPECTHARLIENGLTHSSFTLVSSSYVQEQYGEIWICSSQEKCWSKYVPACFLPSWFAIVFGQKLFHFNLVLVTIFFGISVFPQHLCSSCLPATSIFQQLNCCLVVMSHTWTPAFDICATVRGDAMALVMYRSVTREIAVGMHFANMFAYFNALSDKLIASIRY